MNLEEHNLNEIEGLSQRGRTLSIVDLINANTLDVDMAAYSLYAIANGASFLTAARPGNAGKTTLMACLLTFLPPGVQIVTVSDPSVITNAGRLINSETANKLCFLCHEIGRGHWHGYLWGRYVGQMFRLMNDDCRIVSCIHADTLPELHNILVSRELDVSEENFKRLGLILFIKLEREITGYRRRVATFYESNGDKHNLLFDWKPEPDIFRHHFDQKFDMYKQFIKELMASGNTDFRWVRSQVIKFYTTFSVISS